jgi:hypothetical protein
MGGGHVPPVRRVGAGSLASGHARPCGGHAACRDAGADTMPDSGRLGTLCTRKAAALIANKQKRHTRQEAFQYVR